MSDQDEMDARSLIESLRTERDQLREERDRANREAMAWNEVNSWDAAGARAEEYQANAVARRKAEAAGEDRARRIKRLLVERDQLREENKACHEDMEESVLVLERERDQLREALAWIAKNAGRVDPEAIEHYATDALSPSEDSTP